MKRIFVLLTAMVIAALLVGVASAAQAQSSRGKETLTGVFSERVGDDFVRKGPHKSEYVVTDNRGKTTKLNIDSKRVAEAAGGTRELNGKRVIVKGTRVSEDKLKAEKIQRDQGSSDPVNAFEADAAVTGSKPAITVLCRFGDSTSTTPRDPSYFQGLVGGTTKPGMDHFWSEVSYNNMNLSGSQVSGWYNLPKARSAYLNADGSANLQLLAEDCTGVADNNVNFSGYTTINMMFNDQLDGSAWGGGVFLNRDGQSKVFGATWMPPWAYDNVGILGHEMGHSYGLPHSSGPYNNTYDSWWDVMSSAGLLYRNLTDKTDCHRDATYGCMAMGTISAHKDKLGWIPSAQKYTAAQGTDNTVTIERLGNTAAGNYLMAQIPIGGSSTIFYTVEARRAVGYDAHAAGEAIVVHKVDTTGATGLTRIARVVDPDGNGNPNDAGAQFLPGETFTDSANGISIQVTGSTASGYTVRIRNGATTTTVANDNFASAQGLAGTGATGSNVGATKETGEPNHAGDAGGKSVWYEWTPQASGPASMDTSGSDFDTLLVVYTGGSVSGLTEVASNDDANGGKQSKVDFAATAGTTYRIAVDGYGAATGNIALHVNSASADTTAPTVSLATPNDGASYTKGEVVKAGYSCADEQGGSGIKSCQGPVPSGSNIDTATAGTKSFAVTATDNAGNTKTVTHSYTVVAPTTYQESDQNLAGYGLWGYYKDPSFSGGYSAYSNATGDSATFRFTGTSVAWKTNKLPDSGITAVYLDGVKVKSFDAYSATAQYNVTGYSKTGLASGAHTLKLVVTGAKNASSSGTYAEIDRFVVGTTSYQENDWRIGFGPWGGAANASASGGTYRQSTSTAQGAFFYGFSGPYVELVTAKGPSYGAATIGVYDSQTNALVKTVTPNLNAATVQWRVPVRVALPDPGKEYYLKVTSAAGKPVVVDAYNAFPFQGAAAAAPTPERASSRPTRK